MEAASLPRGLAHTVSRGTSSHDRNMQSIQGFLTGQYEKSKSPGLNQGLAGKNRTKIIQALCYLERHIRHILSEFLTVAVKALLGPWE